MDVVLFLCAVAMLAAVLRVAGFSMTASLALGLVLTVAGLMAYAWWWRP